jgi:hypothetical protein
MLLAGQVSGTAMKFSDLLKLTKGGTGAPPSSGDVRQAIERAEAAAREASERLDALTAERAAALVDDDDATLDRVETETTKARRDLDRAELAVEELQRRLVETEAAEERARIDDLYDRAADARDRSAELVRGRYARLATEMRDLMLEIEALDELVVANNRKLIEARHPRIVQHVAEHEQVHRWVRLPGPAGRPDDPATLLWPPDRFGAASRSFAAAMDAAYAKARGG